ncbi:MAG: hypothetical protein HKP58_06170 [Desulfatitalea sp.]|nr:hypothetical protein [Desulfatitalea sp.]NNJ99982.1 hypothetical protein [Desulfatitalea sp.]
MNPKYTGIGSVGVAVTALAMILLYFFGGWWRPAPQRGLDVVASAPAAWLPSQEQLEAMAQLSDRLTDLADPSPRRFRSASLALLGQPASSAGGSSKAVARNEGPTYVLSLTLLAGPVRYCILNANVVAEGERLRDGSLVVRIEARRVLLAGKHKQQWIALQDALDEPERADTLSASPRRDNT